MVAIVCAIEAWNVVVVVVAAARYGVTVLSSAQVMTSKTRLLTSHNDYHHYHVFTINAS